MQAGVKNLIGQRLTEAGITHTVFSTHIVCEKGDVTAINPYTKKPSVGAASAVISVLDSALKIDPHDGCRSRQFASDLKYLLQGITIEPNAEPKPPKKRREFFGAADEESF